MGPAAAKDLFEKVCIITPIQGGQKKLTFLVGNLFWGLENITNTF